LCDVEKRTVLNTRTLAGEASERLFAECIRGVRVQDLEPMRSGQKAYAIVFSMSTPVSVIDLRLEMN